MAYITKYGTIWGAIPQTAGRVFWVAPGDSYTVDGRSYPASDNNDGLSPERALRSVNRAWELVTANAGDVIVLLPGDHTVDTSIAANVAGVTMTGLPGGAGNLFRQKTSLTISIDDEVINVTAADIEIAYLHIIPVTTEAGIDFTADADRLHVHHCSFDMFTAAADTGTIGIDALGAASHVLIDHCSFQSDGAQGAGVDMTATLDSVVEHCVFAASAGTWAAALTVGAATDRLLIRYCDFLDFNGTITAGISGTGADVADGVAIHDCRFGENVTVPIDNFDAGEAQISQNYDFGIGATDGGVLITAIT